MNDRTERGASDRSGAALAPLVFVVGAPYVAQMLAADPTLPVHPKQWRSLEEFADDAAERRIPLDGPFVVCTSTDAATADVSLDAFLALFRDVTVLVHPSTSRTSLYEQIATRFGAETLPGAPPPPPPTRSDEEAPVPKTERRLRRPTARDASPPPPSDPLVDLLHEVADQAPTRRGRRGRPVDPPVDPSSSLLASLDVYTRRRPATEEPATEERAAEEPAVEESAVDEPAPDESAVEEFAVEECAAEGCAAEEFAPEEFAVDEAAPEEPAAVPAVAEAPTASAEAPHPVPAAPSSRVIAVFSPTGGVGRTDVAVELAARLAADPELAVCIVDLDIGVGNVGTRLDVFTPTIRKLLVEPELDADALARNLAHDERTGVHALLAPLRPEARADRRLLTPAVYARILDLLVDRFDAVVLDCSVDLDDPLVARFALVRAGEVVVVVNDEEATLLDARRVVEMMTRPAGTDGEGLGVERDRIKVVVNPNAKGDGGDIDQVSTVLTGEDPAHPLNDVPIVALSAYDHRLSVGHADLAAGEAAPRVDAPGDGLDDALAILLQGAPTPVAAAEAPDPAEESTDTGSDPHRFGRDPGEGPAARGTGLRARLRRRKG